MRDGTRNKCSSIKSSTIKLSWSVLHRVKTSSGDSKGIRICLPRELVGKNLMSAGRCIFRGAESQHTFPRDVGLKVTTRGSCSPVSPWEYFSSFIAEMDLSQSLWDNLQWAEQVWGEAPSSAAAAAAATATLLHNFCEASAWQRAERRGQTLHPYPSCCWGMSPCAPCSWFAAPRRWLAGGTGSDSAVMAAVASIYTLVAQCMCVASQWFHGWKRAGEGKTCWQWRLGTTPHPAVDPSLCFMSPCRHLLASFGDQSPVTWSIYRGFPHCSSWARYLHLEYTHPCTGSHKFPFYAHLKYLQMFRFRTA